MIKNEKIDAMLETAEVQTSAISQLRHNLAHWSKCLGGTNDSEEEVLIVDSGKKVYLFSDSAILLAVVGSEGYGHDLTFYPLKNVDYIKLKLEGFVKNFSGEEVPIGDVRADFRIAGTDFTINLKNKYGQHLMRILKTKLIPAMEKT